MSTETRRRPDEFHDDARKIRAGWDHQTDEPDDNPAHTDQLVAASRDARRIMGEALEDVVDVASISAREIALILALAAAADRRGYRSPHDPTRPGPEIVNLQNRLRGHCDVCETRAHRLLMMLAQYGPYVYRARVCVRCRRFAPDEPLDAAA